MSEIYVYSDFLDIDFSGLMGMPLIGPVIIRAGEPYRIPSVTKTWRTPVTGRWVKHHYDPEAVYRELMSHGVEEQGLIRLKGPIPTDEERARSRRLGQAYATLLIGRWRAHAELMRSRGMGIPRPGHYLVLAAQRLRRENPRLLRLLGVDPRLLEELLWISGDVTTIGLNQEYYERKPLGIQEVEGKETSEAELTPLTEPVEEERVEAAVSSPNPSPSSSLSLEGIAEELRSDMITKRK